MRKFLALISEEFSESFGFPTLESLVFFFLLFEFIGFTASSSVSTLLYVSGTPLPESGVPVSMLFVSDFMTMIIQIMISVVASALIAGSLAGAFESGLMRTLSSYPIGKTSLVLVKLTVTVIITGGIITAGIVGFVPVSGLLLLPASSIMGLIASIWLTLLMVSTTAVVLSLFFKSESISMLLSILVWFALIILASMIPNSLLSAIVRPNIALTYIGISGASLSSTEIVEALSGSLTIIALMLSISVIYSSKFMQS